MTRTHVHRFALAVAAAVLPLAAAITAIALAPAYQLRTPVAGAEVTAKAVLGSTVHRATIFSTTFRTRSVVSLGPIPVGTRLRFAYDQSLTKPDGGLDATKINTIIQDFSHPRATAEQVSHELTRHYAFLASVAAEATLLCEAAALALLKVRARRLGRLAPELRDVVVADRRLPRGIAYTAGAMAGCALVIAPSVALARPSAAPKIVADPLLAKIGIRGVAVSGPIGDLQQLIGPSVASYLNRVDAFYRAEADAFAAAFRNRPDAGERAPDTKRIVFADDFQGQEGPARIVGDAARAYHADLIVVGGDTTTSGSSLETYELSSLREHAGDIPALISRGKHDPELDGLRAMVKGFDNYHVADGKIHKIGGIDVLGLNAPTRLTSTKQTEVIEPGLSGDTPVEATIAKTHQVITQACSADGPLVVTMHDQLIGTPLAQAGCSSVPLVLAGREFTVRRPMQFGPTTEIVSGSTGGHTDLGGLEAYSELRSPATFQVLTIDATTYRLLSDDLVTLGGPQPSADIRRWVPLDAAGSLRQAAALTANLATSD